VREFGDIEIFKNGFKIDRSIYEIKENGNI